MHKTGGFLHIQRILKRDTKRARRDKECAPQQPDSMKKELTPYGVGSFFISSATFLSQVVFNEVRECTWLGYRPPAPCGRNRGPISPGRVRTATPYFSDCPNQCAALYLVRILSAARCAGFRQAKSPGRVGRCRIPEHPPSTIIRHYCFFF